MADDKRLCARQFERTIQPSRQLVRKLSVLTIVLFGICLTFKVAFLIVATTKPSQSSPFIEWVRENGAPKTRHNHRRKHTAHRRHSLVFPIENGRCSSDHLGLPPIVAERCTSLNSTSAEFSKCSRLTCANLLTGNPARKRDAALYRDAVDFFPEQRVIKNTQHDHSRQAILGQQGDMEIVNATSTPEDCAEFRRSRGFIDWVDADAADFPIAYNILVHANAKQAALLLRAIYRPNNIYCFHVDRRAPEYFQSAIQSLAGCFDNVKLASKPVAVVYAGYSRLQADINCMKDHINSSVKWKYLINTAGQAFPLRTVEETVRILKIYNGSNDFEGIYGRRVIHGRYAYEYIELAERGKILMSGRSNPKPPHGITIVRGSAYGIFSRPFVDWLLTDRRPVDLLDWAKRTFSPDEFYWSTLHHAYANPTMGAPGSYAGYPSSKPWLAVYVSWPGEHPCRGQWVRSVCVFGVGDLPTLVRRPELFANKFFWWYQPIALDCLDQWLRHKEACPPVDDDLEYYRQLPFIIK